MNRQKRSITLFLIAVFCCFPLTPAAKDMRKLNIQADRAKAELIQKAAQEKSEARRLAAASNAAILQDKTKLEKNIRKLQNTKRILQQENTRLSITNLNLSKEEKRITLKLTQTDQMINELVGVIRTNAKDFSALLNENHQTALRNDSPDFLEKLADEDRFPGMDTIRLLATALFDQIKQTGEVTRPTLPIIDRNGKTVVAKLLVLGPFCAAYQLGGEIGFLRYSVAGNRFYALSKLPPKRMQKQLLHYMEGKSDFVPMDISRGGALQQLTHSLNFWDQIQKGGPIVWPILILFFFGLIIICERIIFLMRKRFNSERFIRYIGEALQQSNWQKCEQFCLQFPQKPVAKIINAGLQCRDLEREEMENVLQEAILREIPPMERFLSTLGMLAAIAPLLGLLGTVTGMIDTFHIITLYGTGDPKLMSGGISEALVTTMLGLSVAIPLMLAQTLLNRAVEKEIGTMEEKAVALVNIIQKNRLDSCSI